MARTSPIPMKCFIEQTPKTEGSEQFGQFYNRVVVGVIASLQQSLPGPLIHQQLARMVCGMGVVWAGMAAAIFIRRQDDKEGCTAEEVTGAGLGLTMIGVCQICLLEVVYKNDVTI